jgi:Neuraminidase (sialidase)
VIWETLKYSAVKFHKKIFNNTVEKRAREISFGFKIKIDNQTTCSFKLDGDLDDNLILESMDKALKHTKELKNQEIPPSERPIFSTYDTNSHNWKRINITEELKKKRLKK